MIDMRAGLGGGDFSMLNITKAPLLNTYIKITNTTGAAINEAQFSTSIAAHASATSLSDAAILQPALNTDEQTIIDIIGSGVLTNVITPYNSNVSSVVYTVVVTADGTDAVYTMTTSAINELFILGYLSQFNRSLLQTDGSTGLGSSKDYGFSASGNVPVTIHTPVQVVNQTKDYGIKFEQSLKVTIQSSVNMVADVTSKAYALYTTFIPKGV